MSFSARGGEKNVEEGFFFIMHFKKKKSKCGGKT